MNTNTHQPTRGGNTAVQLSHTVALLEASRADSATQRDRAIERSDFPAEQFYSGRVQAFDLALAELRDLVQGGAA